jgi:hypothetical protein
LYPGNHYESLASYLNAITIPEGDVPEYVTVHDLSLEEGHPDKILHYKSPEKFGRDCTGKQQQHSPSLLVFLRGHPSPEWLRTIGYVCNLDPEFLRQHLEFRWTDKEKTFYTSPGLPSSSSNIIRLRVPNIVTHKKRLRLYERHP